MSQVTILLSPIKFAISAHGGALDVLFRVHAPERPADTKATTAPKRLALVVDRSGSRDGQPLTEALGCVPHITNSMTPADALSVVVYDDNVNVVVPLASMTHPTQVHQALVSGGKTNLFDSFDEERQLLQALCLRQLDLKIIPAPGVIIEPLGLVQKNPDGSYRISDLAWGSESWMMLRLHVSPSAVGDTRDLLAASLQAHTPEGEVVSTHAAMLSLSAVDATAFDALAPDQSVLDRLQEVEFAQASQELHTLVQQGEILMARKLLEDLEKRFGQHPWLQDKLKHLRELTQRDPELMGKEACFSAMRMSSRLSAKSEARYSVDETDLVIPAFLRKKGQEGRGRSQPHVASPDISHNNPV